MCDQLLFNNRCLVNFTTFFGTKVRYVAFRLSIYLSENAKNSVLEIPEINFFPGGCPKIPHGFNNLTTPLHGFRK
jgi:hypothetical protein